MDGLVDRSLLDLLEFIVDNRGRTCPVSDRGFPLIATNCIKEGRREVVFENIRFVDDDTYRNWFRSHLLPGDVLFVCKGSPGRVAVVPDPVSYCIAQDMVALRASRDVDSSYLYYRLCAPDVRASIGNMHVGTMIPHFKKGDFGRLRFMVHVDAYKQKAIAEVLGALDDKIAANRNITMSSVLLAESLVLRSSTGSIKRLGDIADITMGSSPKGETLNEGGDGMVFFQGVRDFGIIYPAPRVYAQAPVKKAAAGDTLLAVRAPVGRVNVAVEETCIGRGIAAVRSATPVTTFYALRAFESLWGIYQGSGTVFSSVSGPEVRGFQIQTVPNSLMDGLEAQIGAIHNRALAAEQESEILARTRDELLPLLMSGKITVKQAEAQAEEVL